MSREGNGRRRRAALQFVQHLSWEVLVGVCAAGVIAAGSLIWALAQSDKGATNAQPDRDTAGWFDSSGNREAIPYRDALTPWTDQASFNCLSETPSYGDERAFFDARHANTPAGDATDMYKTRLDVEPGDELVLRMYIHNCADPAVNSGEAPRGDALDSRVRIVARQTEAEYSIVYGYITAANADPEWVGDTVELLAQVPVRLEFLPDSAKLFGNRLPEEGVPLSDTGFVVSDHASPPGRGSTIGTDGVDGVVTADGFGGELVVEVVARVLG